MTSSNIRTRFAKGCFIAASAATLLVARAAWAGDAHADAARPDAVARAHGLAQGGGSMEAASPGGSERAGAGDMASPRDCNEHGAGAGAGSGEARGRVAPIDDAAEVAAGNTGGRG